MVLAWKTIAKLNGLDFLKTPVILEEIRVYSATIVTKPIRLDVIVTPGNGYFEIMDGDQLAASGYIRIIDEDMPFYYKNVNEIRTSEIAERIELDTEDAYKEFLLRGYEYGQAFRGIYRACNSGERGMLYWTALLAERADSLRLPTRVRYLRIDPVKHMEHIQEKDGIQVIELRNDVATNGCIAGGVECCDLTAHTVARRLQSAGQLYYEKIYFTKHFDKKAFDEFPQIREELNAYRDFLRSMLANGLAKWEVNGCLKELTNGALLSDAVRKFTKFMNPVSEVEHKRWLDDSQSPVATVFDEVFAIEIDNPKDLENKDTCIENSTGHNCKACALEFNSTEQLKFCVDAVNSHPLLEMEWLCVGPKVDDMDESTLVQLGFRKVPKVVILSSDIRNMLKYLLRCKEMLRDDGFIILVETTSDYEIALAIQGLSAEVISVSDSGRIYGTYFAHDQLLKLFEECKFRLCNYQTDPSMMTTMYAIRKIPSQAREPIVIDVDDIEEFTWIEPLQKQLRNA
ncbi:Fatty acid synthase [Dirofilaria immitis]|nr:Fatty acid synthase [Dirofilaria immitis]